MERVGGLEAQQHGRGLGQARAGAAGRGLGCTLGRPSWLCINASVVTLLPAPHLPPTCVLVLHIHPPSPTHHPPSHPLPLPPPLLYLAHTPQTSHIFFMYKLHLCAVSFPLQGVIWRAMWRTHSRSFLVSGAIKLVHDVVMFAGPVLLELLLKHVQAG